VSHSSETKNQRLLVVDDNPAIHEDFRKIFGAVAGNESMAVAEMALFGADTTASKSTDFTIDSALQGHEGLARLQQALAAGRPYALAFVDVRMPPGWDGIETTTRMWEIDPDLQVVICTAYSDYSWDNMRATLGKSDRLVILKKPFDNIEVLQLAEALTSKWQLQRQSRQQLRALEATLAQRTEQLRQSEERFHLITENIADLIAIVDSDGQPLYHSPAYERLLGYHRDELPTTLAFTQIHPDDRNRVITAARQATESGIDQVLEYRMQCKDGTWRTIESHGRPFRTATGAIEGVLTVARDVTARHQTEQERKQMELQLQQER
jgi:PAS domain S-box-containing protein